jgi:acyl-coenzyme A thioesterase PaaI-like protein
MAETGEPAALENDPQNPCFGCGPANPLGLRLAFERRGDRVTTQLTASPELQGWPGRLHSGVLYTAMLETANWALFGLTGRLGVPVETSALAAARWVAVGERLVLTGRVARLGPSGSEVEVEATDARGVATARLQRRYLLPGREEFLERMGYSTLPDVLAGLLPP